METELDQLAEELTRRREVDKHGIIRYFNENDELHRIHGPAVIYVNGDNAWYINGIEYSKKDFNAHPLVIAHRAKAAL